MTERQTVAGAYDKIAAHEDLCAERYKNIHESLGDLKDSASTSKKTLWGVLLTLLGFMAVQLYTANDARLEALERPSPQVVVQQKNNP